MADDISPLPSSKLLLGTPKTTIAIAANCGRCHSDRPAWWTDEDGVDYEPTSRDEPFKDREVSRKSVASLIVKIIDAADYAARSNLGVNKHRTEGDKPTIA